MNPAGKGKAPAYPYTLTKSTHAEQPGESSSFFRVNDEGQIFSLSPQQTRSVPGDINVSDSFFRVSNSGEALSLGQRPVHQQQSINASETSTSHGIGMRRADQELKVPHIIRLGDAHFILGQLISPVSDKHWPLLLSAVHNPRDNVVTIDHGNDNVFYSYLTFYSVNNQKVMMSVMLNAVKINDENHIRSMRIQSDEGGRDRTLILNMQFTLFSSQSEMVNNQSKPIDNNSILFHYLKGPDGQMRGINETAYHLRAKGFDVTEHRISHILQTYYAARGVEEKVYGSSVPSDSISQSALFNAGNTYPAASPAGFISPVHPGNQIHPPVLPSNAHPFDVFSQYHTGRMGSLQTDVQDLQWTFAEPLSLGGQQPVVGSEVNTDPFQWSTASFLSPDPLAIDSAIQEMTGQPFHNPDNFYPVGSENVFTAAHPDSSISWPAVPDILPDSTISPHPAWSNWTETTPHSGISSVPESLFFSSVTPVQGRESQDTKRSETNPKSLDEIIAGHIRTSNKVKRYKQDSVELTETIRATGIEVSEDQVKAVLDQQRRLPGFATNGHLTDEALDAYLLNNNSKFKREVGEALRADGFFVSENRISVRRKALGLNSVSRRTRINRNPSSAANINRPLFPAANFDRVPFPAPGSLTARNKKRGIEEPEVDSIPEKRRK